MIIYLFTYIECDINFIGFFSSSVFLSVSLSNSGAGEEGRVQAVAAVCGPLGVRGRCGSSFTKLLERESIREARFLLTQNHRQENVPQWVSTDTAFQIWLKSIDVLNIMLSITNMMQR